jgi:hypothetical protein
MVFANNQIKSELNSKTKTNHISLFIVFLVLVLFIGFRHEVGGDWSTYLDSLEFAKDETIYITLSVNDPGYQMLNWIGANVGGGIYFVNFICAIIFTYGLIEFCKHQASPFLSLVVAFPYLIMIVAMGYSRQGVAIGLAMLALSALVLNKTFKFASWILVAMLFHKSAIILLPFLIFIKNKKRLINFFGIAIIFILSFFLFISERLDDLNNGYLVSEYDSSGALVRVLMNALPSCFFIYYRKRFRMNETQQTFWLWMSFASIAFLGLLWISPSTTAVDRIALYWIPLQLIVWSNMPNVLGVKDGRNVLYSLSVIFYSSIVLFVWLFYAENSSYWIPYKFYPLVWLSS